MKNKTIVNETEIDAVINSCDVCNLGMVDSFNNPYVIPMNFGYQQGVIYLHSGPKGKKIDILEQNNNVCITFSTDHKLRWQSEGVACSYSMKYRSVVAYGKVLFVESPEEKISALNNIMKNYTGRSFKYSDPAVRDVKVFKVEIESIEGRTYGY